MIKADEDDRIHCEWRLLLFHSSSSSSASGS
jgi:hypothetical protein